MENNKYEKWLEKLEEIVAQKRNYIDTIKELLEKQERIERHGRVGCVEHRKYTYECINIASSMLRELTEKEQKQLDILSNLTNDVLGEIYEDEKGIQEEFD